MISITKLDKRVPLWYNGSMKDYTITTKDGQEITCRTLTEAKREAIKLPEPFIDEYSEELGELTGRYWKLEDGKWVQCG